MTPLTDAQEGINLMTFDPAIFFAALGITMLEIVEASAVGLALYGESRRPAAFLLRCARRPGGLRPHVHRRGHLLQPPPLLDVKLIGGVLLLYFGQRLIKSARRSVLNAREEQGPLPTISRSGLMSTGFSVGAIEAFEAAIVLIGLLPYNYSVDGCYGHGLGDSRGGRGHLRPQEPGEERSSRRT